LFSQNLQILPVSSRPVFPALIGKIDFPASIKTAIVVAMKEEEFFLAGR
jgi:hypothetical protein